VRTSSGATAAEAPGAKGASPTTARSPVTSLRVVKFIVIPSSVIDRSYGGQAEFGGDRVGRYAEESIYGMSIRGAAAEPIAVGSG
jgi:hypothetical protein